MGTRAVPKRDISPCNYITQNKKPKLQHSAINAGSIDFCTAPSWLINSRCSYKTIPALASLQQEINGRILKAEIPSCTDLLSPRSFKKTMHSPPLPSPKLTFWLPVLQSQVSHCPWDANAGPQFHRQRCLQPPPVSARAWGDARMQGTPFWMQGISHLHLPQLSSCHRILTKTP